MTPVLQASGLIKHYGGVAAVADADIAVDAGTITALIGPNGAGKSTLFNLVTGFERPERGQVALFGRPTTHLPAFLIARRGMVRTFQLTKALSSMTVLDNLRVGAADNPGERLAAAIARPLTWRRREREIDARARTLLDRFGLLEAADEPAGTLSGGQRKLLEVARALMPEPRILLLDEPLAGVSPRMRGSVLSHIEGIRSELGVTVLFIEHDLDAVRRLADRAVVMSEGRVIADGPPETLRTNTRVIDAYLGSLGEVSA
jgi:branched-chain amino acid transport system ATP-binding protein